MDKFIDFGSSQISTLLLEIIASTKYYFINQQFSFGTLLLVFGFLILFCLGSYILFRLSLILIKFGAVCGLIYSLTQCDFSAISKPRESNQNNIIESAPLDSLSSENMVNTIGYALSQLEVLNDRYLKKN